MPPQIIKYFILLSLAELVTDGPGAQMPFPLLPLNVTQSFEEVAPQKQIEIMRLKAGKLFYELESNNS